MRFVLNAVALRAGGGLTVGLEVVRHLAHGAPEDEFVVLASPGCGYEQLHTPRIAIRTVPWKSMSHTRRLWFLNKDVPQICRSVRADALFSMGNTATLTSTVPQLVLFHQAYMVYPEVVRNAVLKSTVARALYVLTRWYFARGVRRTTVACQTETMRQRLIEQFHCDPGRVLVVPNAISARNPQPVQVLADSVRGGSRRSLVVLSRYYPHKNLEILTHVVRGLYDKGFSDFVILTTMSPDDHSGAARWLKATSDQGLLDSNGPIWNLGPVAPEEVYGLLRTAWACLLPTLLESFSGTYLEAMQAGCPILTSDRDFAREVCGDAAIYFDPMDANSIVSAVMALENTGVRQSLIAAGKQRLKNKFGDWSSVTVRYMQILRSIAQGDS